MSALMQQRDQRRSNVAVPFMTTEKLFSETECDAIVALGLERGLEAGRVWDPRTGDYSVSPDWRRVATCYMRRHDTVRWIFERMDALFSRAATFYGFDVTATSEPLKFLAYGVGDHFNGWHMDTGHDHAQFRKLSMSIELCPRGSFAGGHLEIFPDRVGSDQLVERGGAVVFPSFRMHRVTPVTRGIRYALVNWISGPAFR